MTRAPYLGLAVVCAAGLNLVSVAATDQRVGSAGSLIGDDIEAAFRWYATLLACLPLSAAALAFLALSLAGTWSLRDGRAGLTRAVAVLVLMSTVLTSWSAGYTPWQGVCIATALLCFPVFGYRGRPEGGGRLPVGQQGGAGAPLLVEQG